MPAVSSGTISNRPKSDAHRCDRYSLVECSPVGLAYETGFATASWLLCLGITMDLKLSLIAAWVTRSTHKRLPVLKPELIALDLEGVADTYERDVLHANQRITEPFFLSQPGLFLLLPKT